MCRIVTLGTLLSVWNRSFVRKHPCITLCVNYTFDKEALKVLVLWARVLRQFELSINNILLIYVCNKDCENCESRCLFAVMFILSFQHHIGSIYQHPVYSLKYWISCCSFNRVQFIPLSTASYVCVRIWEFDCCILCFIVPCSIIILRHVHVIVWGKLWWLLGKVWTNSREAVQ